MMASIVQPQRDVPVIADVDVCAIGGGPGGLPAAISAARQGASVMLVEMQGFLGGMATAGQIGPLLGHKGSKSNNVVIEGIFKELCVRMAEIGQAPEWEKATQSWGVSFGAEGFKIVADRLVKEAGVDTLFHAFFVDSVVEEGRMTHAVIESKSGRQAIKAKVFVDGTGDADLAVRAGAECTTGRPADGKPMSMGSIFRIGGVDTLTDEAKAAALAKAREAGMAGELTNYGAHLGNPGSTIVPGEATVNCTRVDGDCSDVRVLTEAEFHIREETWKTVDAWRSAPGAEGLYLITTPPHVGLRESRQLVGEHRITGHDVVGATKYEDGIARCGYWIDIHCPRGLGVGEGVHLCSTNCKKTDCYMLTEHADQLFDELYPPEGEWFDIPYRTLVPEVIDGLLVSGRCISADYNAMSAMRVMSPCIAIGEAAGVAAAMAAKQGIPPRSVDVAELRATLADGGALV
ncbi:MAG TPA: FAD-dependent oxidoreductase [Armatimonadota bacterium]|nr:FAD-dependent oxidoreductase [Armatimonadota bacterium]